MRQPASPNSARQRGRVRRPSRHAFAALLLLLILLGGLSIIACTHDWIGSLPTHDHVILGARAMGLVHHAHPGDSLSHWMNGVEMVGAVMPDEATTSGPGDPTAREIVSITSFSGLQPEMNSYTATGLCALIALLMLALRGVRLPSERAVFPDGRSLTPPLPPPRPFL